MLKFVAKVLSLLIAIVLSSYLLTPEKAQAQIRYSPLVIEATAEQGQARGILEISNGGSQPFRGRIYAEPFTYDRDGLKVLLSSPLDLTPFLTFSPREVVIEPGQTRRIRLVSQFLPGTPSGEYRAVILIKSLEEITTQGQTSGGIKPSFSVPMYVRQGNTMSNLSVDSVNFNPESRNLELLVFNRGNASAFTNTAWTLKKDGITTATGDSKDFTVIAGAERNIIINFLDKGKQVASGKYQLSGQLVFGNPERPDKLPFNVDLSITEEQATTANRAR